jgi:hypothetical protein
MRCDSAKLLFTACLCSVFSTWQTEGQHTLTEQNAIHVNLTLTVASELTTDQQTAFTQVLKNALAPVKPMSVVQQQPPLLEADIAEMYLLVYPSKPADVMPLLRELETVQENKKLLQELQTRQLAVVKAVATSVSAPKSGTLVAREPVTGSSLAGIVAVIAVGVILISTMAIFGVRSLLQIRDQMAKAKAGYSVVKLSDEQGQELGNNGRRDDRVD